MQFDELKRKVIAMSNSLVTPVGEVMFAYVKNEEVIHQKDGKVIPTGKYSITLNLPDDDTEKFNAAIAKVWEEFLENNKQDREFNLAQYMAPTRTFNDKTYFVFRKNVSAISKESNQPVKLYVPLFDAENKNCTNEVRGIGRGSKVKVSFSFYPFYMNANNYGVSLRLNALQIIDLVSLTSNGSKYGFEVIPDGFVAQASESETEIPY